jgi:hypothetical protein
MVHRNEGGRVRPAQLQEVVLPPGKRPKVDIPAFRSRFAQGKDASVGKVTGTVTSCEILPQKT